MDAAVASVTDATAIIPFQTVEFFRETEIICCKIHMDYGPSFVCHH